MAVLRRLFSYLRPYWKALVLTAMILLVLVRTGLHLTPPLIQRRIVDDVIEAEALERLIPLIGLYIGVYAVMHLMDFGEMYLRHALGERFILDLRIRLYSHLQRLSLAFF